MAMSEQEILHHLKVLYPDSVIYADIYGKTRDSLGVTLLVHQCAKAAGLTSKQWLTAHGFVWKETGYVEPDMKHRAADPPSGEEAEDAYKLAHYVFSRYPLAGEYILTKNEADLLYQTAFQTVQKIVNGTGHPSPREDAVLVLSTIELLKKWSTSAADDEDSSFWNHIYLQYSFNPEKSEAAERRLYKHFREAIKSTLNHYGRFFAPDTTHRYYKL